MNNIFEATDDFSFKSIKLSKPKSIAGGNWLIKFTVNNSPLYIQAPKCNTKNGFLKAGKRYYTDLVFSNDNDEFIRWMENLEIMCHEHLHENRSTWFDSEMILERHDIENYFTSPMKIYKTGKYYIVRVNVETNLGVPALTIYDESNKQVGIDTINDKQDVISILELKGIKCTSTSFQIDIEMKQMVTFKPVKLFTKCVIKLPSNLQTNTPYDDNAGDNVSISEQVTDEVTEKVIIDNNLVKQENTEIIENQTLEPIEDTDPVINDEITIDTLEKVNNENDTSIPINDTDSTLLEKNDTELPIDNNKDENNIEVDTTVETNNNELQEFTIDLDSLTEDVNINIKKDNDIYYEMYREARRKAKIASDLALSSYLEAKRIKNLYMLDDLSDSDDSDENSELDEEE